MFQVMPEKKFLHSQTVVCFCTALIVEIVGSMLSLDNNLVKRVLPLVFASLNSSISSADYKVGYLILYFCEYHGFDKFGSLHISKFLMTDNVL